MGSTLTGRLLMKSKPTDIPPAHKMVTQLSSRCPGRRPSQASRPAATRPLPRAPSTGEICQPQNSRAQRMNPIPERLKWAIDPARLEIRLVTTSEPTQPRGRALTQPMRRVNLRKRPSPLMRTSKNSLMLVPG
jgi:hypothetical protein